MNTRSGRKVNNSNEPHVSFKNTRSKFYQKRPSEMEDFTQSHASQNLEKNTGNYWKQQGNTQFKRGNMEKAIQFYSQAIQQNPSQSVFFSNRAKSFKKLGKFQEALKDAEQSCELDPQNIKANYICGCILAQLGKFDHPKLSKAQNRFKKALRLCSSFKRSQFEDQISIKYYRLKKLMWYIEQSQEIEDLIVEKNQISLNQKFIEQTAFKRILSKIDKRLKGLIDFPKTKQIPDYLCCKITLQLMEDPVTTQEGFTYEKSALDDHFKTNGHIEPISRNKLSTEPFPNLALKIAIEDFLNQNPWAFEDGTYQDYFQIKF